MLEIIKLYENAEIKPIDIAEYGSTYIPKKIEINGKPYPPFTAEKQISLIILLSYKYDKGLLINLRTTDKDIDIYDFELFSECLAKLVNELWQDLTEEEHKQIKNILESEVRE